MWLFSRQNASALEARIEKLERALREQQDEWEAFHDKVRHQLWRNRARYRAEQSQLEEEEQQQLPSSVARRSRQRFSSLPQPQSSPDLVSEQIRASRRSSLQLPPRQEEA